MTRCFALLDVSALVPVGLADTLLRVAEVGLYRPLWSPRILDEVAVAIVEVSPNPSSESVRLRPDRH